MGSLAIDDGMYRALDVVIKGGEIDLTLMNGRKVIAPLWLFSELAGMNDDELADVELIEGGTGILVGDKEAVSVRRITGMDADSPPPTKTNGVRLD